MIPVTIIQTESTLVGDIADLILEESIEPVVGMVLIDEDSLTWEVTGTLSDSKRTTGDGTTKRWTFQCRPLNTHLSIHTGEFKLMH